MRLHHLLFSCVLAVGACGTVHNPDTPDARANTDGSTSTPDSPGMPDASDAPPKPNRKGGAVSTSGGGVTASAQHRMRLRIGAPQPIGRSTSSGHNLVTGPGALP